MWASIMPMLQGILGDNSAATDAMKSVTFGSTYTGPVSGPTIYENAKPAQPDFVKYGLIGLGLVALLIVARRVI